jgi:hypothetical protein
MKKTESLTSQENQHYEEVEQPDIHLKHSRLLQEGQQWLEKQRISFLMEMLESQKQREVWFEARKRLEF